MTCKDLLEVMSPAEFVSIDWKQGDNYTLLLKASVVHLNLDTLTAFNLVCVTSSVDEETGLPCVNITVE